MPFCRNCGTQYTEGIRFCGTNLASINPTVTPTPAVMCAYHPASLATGSCSRCLKPTCSVCLTTRSENRLFMGFRSSQVCRLCVRYESASRIAAAVAILVGLASFVISLWSDAGLLGLIAAVFLWYIIRKNMRQRGEVEILGKEATVRQETQALSSRLLAEYGFILIVVSVLAYLFLAYSALWPLAFMICTFIGVIGLLFLGAAYYSFVLRRAKRLSPGQ